jgi:hypothetical protein
LQRYPRADLEPLATVDEAHENLSGLATRRILEREYRQYGKPEYERLASISVAHLYNPRQHPRYRERRLHYTKTRPAMVTIGERRCPDPQGQPARPGSKSRDGTRCAIPIPHCCGRTTAIRRSSKGCCATTPSK